MASSKEYLINAERLISDAEYLYVAGRARSAATLIVVALEELGAFVEALTLEVYPGAETRMGLFTERNRRHANRQDTLAGHVFNFAEGKFAGELVVQAYVVERVALNPDYLKLLAGGGKIDPDDFNQWIASRPKGKPITSPWEEKLERERRQD